MIIETVGVGQSEINIKQLADTVILCVQPGSGDKIQFMKSGIFEISDIILLTKRLASDCILLFNTIKNSLLWPYLY